MTKTKPWNIKEGVYEKVLPESRPQSIDDLRKKGLQAPSSKE